MRRFTVQKNQARPVSITMNNRVLIATVYFSLPTAVILQRYTYYV